MCREREEARQSNRQCVRQREGEGEREREREQGSYKRAKISKNEITRASQRMREERERKPGIINGIE